MKIWDGQPVQWAQHKFDGNYTRIRSGRVFTSHPTEIFIPWITDQFNIPAGEVVLGELYVPGKKASAVKTAIKEKDPSLRFVCFEIPTMDAKWGINVVNIQADMWNIPYAPTCRLANDKPDEWMFNPDLLEQDQEGWVFKLSNSIGHYKWKPIKTIDLIVNGTKDGNGKNLGLVGSLYCSTFEGHEVASVGGMNENDRIEMSLKNPFGRIAEVAYQYVGAKGRLRHPRFIQWRDDKVPQQCGLDQDPELERYWT